MLIRSVRMGTSLGRLDDVKWGIKRQFEVKLGQFATLFAMNCVIYYHPNSLNTKRSQNS